MRRVDDWRRTALDDATSLARIARDLHQLAWVLADNELGYPGTHGGGQPGGHSDPSDPVMRLAVALADPDNAVHDHAVVDRKHLEAQLAAAHRAVVGAYTVYARWTPGLADVRACANPYGCPDLRPAEIPSRLGLCWRCYNHQRKHLGQHRGAPDLEIGMCSPTSKAC